MSAVNVSGTSLRNDNSELAVKSEASRHFQFELIAESVDSLFSSLTYLGDAREVRILKLRHGIEDSRKWTLEEVGVELGVTRERTRQLQVKATRRMSRIAAHVNPGRIDDCLKELTAFGERVGEGLAGERFPQVLFAATGVDHGKVSAYVSILRLLTSNGASHRRSLDEVDRCVVRALVESSAPVSMDDLHTIIRSDPEASKALEDWPTLDLSLRLQLVLNAEIGADDYCKATEQTLLHYSNTDRRLFAITRVLREGGRPLHFTEVARRVRPLLPGGLAMSNRNVHAWLDRYKDHFKWAGPGIFGLVEWDIGVRDGTIEGDLRPARRLGVGDEIALLLSELDEPVSLSYIEDHVLGRFEVNRASISASILQDKARRFVLLDGDMVGLSNWHKPSQSHDVPGPKRRVRLPKEMQDAARSAARRKASDVSALIDQGIAGIPPGKAAGHAIVAAALGMKDEFHVLFDIAVTGNMPATMSRTLKGFSES